MWAVIRLLPELLQYVRTLTDKATIEETREILREQEKWVRTVDKEHDKDPLGTTRGFFSDDRMRDTQNTE